MPHDPEVVGSNRWAFSLLIKARNLSVADNSDNSLERRAWLGGELGLAWSVELD